jgi:hypothetical protein
VERRWFFASFRKYRQLAGVQATTSKDVSD